MADLDIDDREFHTAIHEAGHAVAHNRLHIEQGGLRLMDPGGPILGASVAAGARSAWDAEDATSQVIAFCAGYGALIAAGCPEDAAVCGTADDFEQAEELISFWGLPGALDEWKDRAVTLMRLPENITAVSVIASLLVKHRRLDGDLVDVLIERADGLCTEEEFARYLDMVGMTL